MCQSFKKITAILILLLFCVFLRVGVQPAFAGNLLGLSDYISDDTPLRPNVFHNVGFVLPTGSHGILPSDYIRIDLSNFGSVTAPTSGSGWIGTPTFGVSGSIAYITGITAPPGVGIGISGITATNPNNASLFTFTVDISSDLAGSIVYDYAASTAMVRSSSTTATVTIPATSSSAQLSGFTSPNAFVTFMINGVIVGTTTADASGNFSKLITSIQENENHLVSIFAVDTLGRVSEPVSFSMFTLPHTTNIIENIAIPTTLSLGVSSINQGGTIPVYGMAYPFSQITLFYGSNPVYSEVIQVDGNGLWAYTINTAIHPLPVGMHEIYAQEVVSGGYTSPYTQKEMVTVLPAIAPSIPNPPSVPVISCNPASNGEWSSSHSVTCTWTSPPGSTGYSTLLSPDFPLQPMTSITTTSTSESFTDLEDGIYYYAVRAYANGMWSQSGTYVLKIDHTPPENLIISFEPSIDVPLNEIPTVYFSAQDVTSGIQYYEMSIDGGSYVRITSPFQLPPMEGGIHTIIIRVYDNAGNATSQTVTFEVVSIVAPVITSPSTGDLIGFGETILIEGKAGPNTIVDIYLDGKKIASVKTDDEGTFSYSYNDILFPGEHRIFAQSYSDGNVMSGISDTILFEISLFHSMKGILLILGSCCCPLIVLLLFILLIIKRKRRNQKDETDNYQYKNFSSHKTRSTNSKSRSSIHHSNPTRRK